MLKIFQQSLNLMQTQAKRAWFLTFLFTLFFMSTETVLATQAHHQPSSHHPSQKKLHNTIATSIPSQFEVQGKIGFSDGKKGGSAHFAWVENGEHFDIRLYGPFGAGAVLIQSQETGILLTNAEGKTFQGKTPESILKKISGWDIPVSGLQYWLKGIPSPHSQSHKHVYLKQPEHRLESFTQDGWAIHYTGYRQVKNHWVPKGLVLQRGKIRLKVIFKRWLF